MSTVLLSLAVLLMKHSYILNIFMVPRKLDTLLTPSLFYQWHFFHTHLYTVGQKHTVLQLCSSFCRTEVPNLNLLACKRLELPSFLGKAWYPYIIFDYKRIQILVIILLLHLLYINRHILRGFIQHKYKFIIQPPNSALILLYKRELQFPIERKYSFGEKIYENYYYHVIMRKNNHQ